MWARRTALVGPLRLASTRALRAGTCDALHVVRGRLCAQPLADGPMYRGARNDEAVRLRLAFAHRRGVLRLGVRLRLGSGSLTGGSPLRVLFELGVGFTGGGSWAVLRAPRWPTGRRLCVGLLRGSVPSGMVAVGGGLP